MKRSAFDEHRDRQVAGEYLANIAECMACHGMAPRDDLTLYGARCRPCYDAWCAAANPAWMPNRALTPEERAKLRQHIRNGVAKIAAQATGTKTWAHRLQAREAAGEKLSEVQRKAWRDALGEHAIAVEADAA